jgi:periplasmic protein TonB
MTYAAYIAESRRTRGIRWAGAAVLVIGLHAGGALALLHMREDDSTDAAGAIAIELAPVTAAPAFTSADIAPGPLMQEEARAPEARRETKETVAEETPLLEPAPLAPQPAVQLPEPQPNKNEKPQEKVDEKVAHEENSRQANAAPMTTAPPPSEAKPSNAAAAPAPGLSAIAAKAQATWYKSLAAHINRYKRYPAKARDHKMEGVVSVEFTLDRSGQILTSRVTASSGSAVLDEEAVALLRRAAPLPSPPEEVPPEGISLVLPIHFRMK